MTPAERNLLLTIAALLLVDLDEWTTIPRAERRQKLQQALRDLEQEPGR